MKAGRKAFTAFILLIDIALIVIIILGKISWGRYTFQKAVIKFQSAGGWHYTITIRSVPYGPKKLKARVVEASVEEWVLNQQSWKSYGKGKIKQEAPHGFMYPEGKYKTFHQTALTISYNGNCWMSVDNKKSSRLPCESYKKSLPHIFAHIFPLLTDASENKNLFFSFPRNIKHDGKHFIVFRGTVPTLSSHTSKKIKIRVEVWIDSRTGLIEKVYYSNFGGPNEQCCTFKLMNAYKTWPKDFFKTPQ